MKKSITTFFVILAITFNFAQESDSPEFTGDNFSLEGALAMFKKANSLEEFEKMLNQEDNNINNLDLNNDGNIDYINVDDIKENDNHVIVLSTFVNEIEKQDIATIGIEKTGKEETTLQIEGDQDLYAENTIAEPFDTANQLQKSKGGPSVAEISIQRIFVNVWFWPSVRFLYAPNYVTWISTNRWGFYPRWFKPWHPFQHRIFFERCAPNRICFQRTTNRRMVFARKIYAPRRNFSRIVYKNYQQNSHRKNSFNQKNSKNNFYKKSSRLKSNRR